jgi:hypothetical protein
VVHVVVGATHLAPTFSANRALTRGLIALWRIRYSNAVVNQLHGMSKHPAVAVVESALGELERGIALTNRPGIDSHTVLACAGLEVPAVTTALGRYLTGVLANIVGLDAGLSGELLDEWPDGRAELELILTALLGPGNDFEDPRTRSFRDSWRNPWIAEGVGHAMLVVRARAMTELLPGKVRAIKSLHSSPNIPGIDLLAIYEDDVTAVMIGECKTTKSNGTENLREAAEFFRKVDAGQHSGELLKEILALRPVIPEELRPQITNALWRKRRCYVPAIVFAEKFDPCKERQYLANLEPPRTHRRLVSIELGDFYGFFDAVADAMRAAIEEMAF